MNGKKRETNPQLRHYVCNGTQNKLGRGEVLLLDVREPPEWVEDGYVEGATRLFFADLPEKTIHYPKISPLQSHVQSATEPASH